MSVWNVEKMRKESGGLSKGRVPVLVGDNIHFIAIDAHTVTVKGKSTVYWATPKNCFMQTGFGTYRPGTCVILARCKKEYIKSVWGFEWCSFGLGMSHFFRDVGYSIPELIKCIRRIGKNDTSLEQQFCKFADYLEEREDARVERCRNA